MEITEIKEKDVISLRKDNDIAVGKVNRTPTREDIALNQIAFDWVVLTDESYHTGVICFIADYDIHLIS